MTVDDLREQIRRHGLSVGPDDTVGELAAALLVGRSPKTLRNWRSIGAGPEHETTGRARYRLEALWLFLLTRTDGRCRSSRLET